MKKLVPDTENSRALQSLPDGTSIIEMEAGTPQMEVIDFDYQFTVPTRSAAGHAHLLASTQESLSATASAPLSFTTGYRRRCTHTR